MPVERTEMCVFVCFKKMHISNSASCKDYSANLGGGIPACLELVERNFPPL